MVAESDLGSDVERRAGSIPVIRTNGGVAQLARAPDLHSGGRGFEALHVPLTFRLALYDGVRKCISKIWVVSSTGKNAALAPRRLGSNPDVSTGGVDLSGVLLIWTKSQHGVVTIKNETVSKTTYAEKVTNAPLT